MLQIFVYQQRPVLTSIVTIHSLLLFIQEATIFSIQYTYTVSLGTSYGTLLMLSYTLIMLLLLFYPGVAPLRRLYVR